MNFESFIKTSDNIVSESETKNYNVLVFAFLGDAVWTLYVRDFLASNSKCKSGVLHSKTSEFVRASFQAKLIEMLMATLTEEETRIVNTARNTHTKNIAKNSNIDEYKKATSFESLLGYLYITKQNERLTELLTICKNEIIGDLI